MSNFSYKLKAIDTPAEGSPGTKVSLKVSIEEATEEISRVYLSVAMYGIFEVLKKESDTSFSLNYYIPYDAPYGNYDISIWAVNSGNVKGPVTNLSFRVS
ncbi:MAG TPA: hypothetical protein PK733_11695 [Clostridiales bacterium]|nr:hypothetical protein [Clostridiales bacterium]